MHVTRSIPRCRRRACPRPVTADKALVEKLTTRNGRPETSRSDRKVKEEAVWVEGMKKARVEVVKCLRVNDRRLLDCWEMSG